MKKISFNQGTLSIDQNKITFEVPIQKIMINSAQELEPLFQQQNTSFPCEVQLSSDMLSLVFSYQVSTEFVPFLQARLFDRHIRLSMIDQLTRLGYYFDTQERLATVFQPVNFFTDGQGRIKLLYQGLKGLMPADGYDQEPLFDQIRRLSLMLFSEARYDELRINGLKASYPKAFSGERPWIKKILQAIDLNDLLTLISNERGGMSIPSQTQTLEQPTAPINTQSSRNYEEYERVEEPQEQDTDIFLHLLQRPASQRTQPPNEQTPIEKMEIIKPPIQHLPTKQPEKKETVAEPASKVTHQIKTPNSIPQKEGEFSHKIAQSVSRLRGNPMVFTFTLVSIGSILFVVLIYMMMQSRLQAENEINEMSKGLHLAAIQQYTAATKHFESLDFTKLSKDEQQTVIFSYLRAEEFDKILEINPQYIDVITTYLERIDQFDKVQKITYESPEVLFEKAAALQDMVGMEKEQDKITMDIRRKKKMMDGFFVRKLYDRARLYAENSNDERLIKYYKDKLPNSYEVNQ